MRAVRGGQSRRRVVDWAWNCFDTGSNASCGT